jgi:hypothetical protein
MKLLCKISIIPLMLSLCSCNLEALQNLPAQLNLPAQPMSEPLDEFTVARGLKEALTVGSRKAITLVSVPDGYFGNQLIRILLPEKMRKLADILGKVGFQKQVDEFVLSMNRAAEKAAPQAASIFVDAIGQMSIEDAMGILKGGESAATDYFRRKTSNNLHAAFKPIISATMNEVGATRSYKKIVGNFAVRSVISREPFDLDGYVTTEAVDGLFYMLAQEEKKIRTDPSARVTELLRQVFGNPASTNLAK